MRQQSQSSNSENSRETRKQKIDKKRMIRKSKVQLPSEYTDLKSIDTSKLSREDRFKIQKAKNREAAQRSRDMHRQYVENLEKEVKQLRQDASRRICWRCRKEVDEESSSSDQHTNERTNEENHLLSFKKEDEFSVIQFQSNQPLNQFEFEESLLRVEPQEEADYSSYMKLMLFVCMVAVAVLCMTTNPHQGLKSSRALMEIPTVLNNSIQQSQKEEPKDQNVTGVVPIQKQLIALSSDSCLSSLMTVTHEQYNPKKSLRSYHEPQQLTGANYIASQQGILLCSVHTPKSYSQKYAKIQSPLVKLYLLGSEIKQMLGQFHMLIPLDSNIQINGIYRVAVEIKTVDLVSDHNCLL